MRGEWKVFVGREKGYIGHCFGSKRSKEKANPVLGMCIADILNLNNIIMLEWSEAG